MRIWGLATLTTHNQSTATVVNRKQRPTSSAAGYLMILALRKTSPSSQRGQRHMPGGGNTLCEGHERREVQQWIGNKLCPTDWGQGREFSPTHYRSASSAYTCVANRVVWLQDRLRKTCGRPKAGLYCSPMCSHCNGHICSNIHVLAVSQDSDDDS